MSQTLLLCSSRSLVFDLSLWHLCNNNHTQGQSQLTGTLWQLAFAFFRIHSSLERSTLPHKKKGQLAFVKTTATLAASGWAELQQAVAAIIVPRLTIACPQVSTQSGDVPPREKVFDVCGLQVVHDLVSRVWSV